MKFSSILRKSSLSYGIICPFLTRSIYLVSRLKRRSIFFVRIVPSEVNEVVMGLDGCKTHDTNEFNFHTTKQFLDLLNMEVYGMFS